MASKDKSKKSYNTLRGMKDILPGEQRYWDFIFERVKSFAKDYGFRRIETPILEPAQLFLRSIGTDTDIGSKEMYTFLDASNEKVALRPEGTAGVARAYVQHGMLNQPHPIKLFYFGPFFRHDRPQSGRQRQFWQFGFEILGDEHPVADAQLIAMSYKFYAELGLNIQIDINSIGSVDSRQGYLKELVAYLKKHRKFLNEDDKKRLTKNPLRVLDSKDKEVQKILEEAPQIVDYLSEEDKNHFIMVLEYLDELEVNYNLNPRIVRGLDYYTRTAWEIIEVGREGQQDSLGGAGRYDDLIEELGGRPTPAVGFACGIERTITRIKANDIKVTQADKPEVFVAQLGQQARKKCLKLYEELLKQGFYPAEAFSKDSLKDQLEAANKLGVKYTLMIGQKEIVDDTVLIRGMENGIQEVIDFKKTLPYVAKILGRKASEDEEIK